MEYHNAMDGWTKFTPCFWEASLNSQLLSLAENLLETSMIVLQLLTMRSQWLVISVSLCEQQSVATNITSSLPQTQSTPFGFC